MRRFVLCLAVLALVPPSAEAYSVLTHEAIIDSAWETNLKPLLLRRFPDATPEELHGAHAFAYAGAILQDMGYYPFGSHFFSDLLHYVRSGDYVLNMIRESEDLDEYAFSLGTLAHYAADTMGHSIAVNRSVPIQYPKLRREYGNVVTYEDDPSAHLKVEFGYDVLQVARGHYAPQSYHDFIGFEVAQDVMARAFRDTYGLDISDVFGKKDLAVGTFRFAVSSLIPEMTKVAWNLKKDDLIREQPGLTRRKFVYNLSRASFHHEWDADYRRPGIGARILAFFIRILPKVGPLRALSFKPPTPETDRFFQESFNQTLATYRALLAQVRGGNLTLVNRDLDTGAPTRPGEYRMADEAYAKLARELAGKDPSGIEGGAREAVLAFFGDLNQPYATKADPEKWRDTVAAIDKLRSETRPTK